MPTYDYECRECGHLWELFQQMKDNPKRKCPECGRLRAKRLIGPGAGIIFKGSGFYQTDYRSSSYTEAAKADKKAEKAASEKGGSKSDSSSSSTRFRSCISSTPEQPLQRQPCSTSTPAA